MTKMNYQALLDHDEDQPLADALTAIESALQDLIDAKWYEGFEETKPLQTELTDMKKESTLLKTYFTEQSKEEKDIDSLLKNFDALEALANQISKLYSNKNNLPEEVQQRLQTNNDALSVKAYFIKKTLEPYLIVRDVFRDSPTIRKWGFYIFLGLNVMGAITFMATPTQGSLHAISSQALPYLLGGVCFFMVMLFLYPLEKRLWIAGKVHDITGKKKEELKMPGHGACIRETLFAFIILGSLIIAFGVVARWGWEPYAKSSFMSHSPKAALTVWCTIAVILFVISAYFGHALPYGAESQKNKELENLGKELLRNSDSLKS